MASKIQILKRPDMNQLWMNKIKADFKNLRFIAFQKQGDKDFVKVIMQKNEKEKDTIMFALEVPVSKMTSNEWEHLAQILKTKSYESPAAV
jgi:hypothetical protein